MAGGSDPFTQAALAARLQALPRATRCYVAFSGGADSTALLHALAALRGSVDLPELYAWHLNHGLHPDAAAWASHCARIAEAWGVPCEIINARVDRSGGLSLEEAARLARYAAFAARLESGAALLTAHHADDQAETLLLNLCKGAGPAGLAAMPAVRVLGRGWLLRPLLGWRRASLVAYLLQHAVHWIYDPSNVERRHDRNFLRHEILPALERRWPALVANLSRVSAIQAELDALGTEVAESDMARALDADGGLRIEILQTLTPARSHNLLHHWLRAGAPSATASRRQVGLIRERFMHAAPDAGPRLQLNAVDLRRYQGRLYKLARAATTAAEYPWSLDRPLEIPALGIYIEPIVLLDACPWLTNTSRLIVRFRAGGERFHPRAVAHSNTLKHWLQHWRVPPWRRGRLPLVFEAERLIAVIGYGVAGCDNVAGDAMI